MVKGKNKKSIRMAEELITLKNASKEEQYQSLLPQIKALIEGEKDLIANMANITGALKAQFDHLWTGFYVVRPKDDGEEELVLGPFQGPIACTRIRRGRGVCGTSWEKAETIIVPNVEEFPGHIACSSLSKSEIVLPLIQNNRVIAVLDIDSIHLNTFDQVDAYYLEELLQSLAKQSKS